MTRLVAQACIRELGAIGFGRYIALGGPHANLRPQECLDWGADAVILGECEGNVTEIFEAQRKGILHGKAVNIREIPSPAWEVFHPALRTYCGNEPRLRKPEGITMWSPGCP